MLPMINWANVGIDPTLLGIQQGQNIFAQGQDAYKQAIMNRNLPDKLREALMAQQLANQQQQITNENLPDKLKAALMGQNLSNEQQQIVNRFLPQEKQLGLENTRSLMGSRGLSDQMTRLQLQQMQAGMSPEAQELARREQMAKLTKLEFEANPENLNATQQRKQLADQLKQQQLNYVENRNRMLTGELPTAAVRTQLQKSQLGIQELSKHYPDILTGQMHYLGTKGAAKLPYESMRVSMGIGSPGEIKRVNEYNRSEELIKANTETMIASNKYPALKNAYEDVKAIMRPIVRYGFKESPASYKNRVERALADLNRKFIKQGKILAGGGLSEENPSDVNEQNIDQDDDLGAERVF